MFWYTHIMTNIIVQPSASVRRSKQRVLPCFFGRKGNLTTHRTVNHVEKTSRPYPAYQKKPVNLK